SCGQLTDGMFWQGNSRGLDKLGRPGDGLNHGVINGGHLRNIFGCYKDLLFSAISLKKAAAFFLRPRKKKHHRQKANSNGDPDCTRLVIHTLISTSKIQTHAIAAHYPNGACADPSISNSVLNFKNF